MKSVHKLVEVSLIIFWVCLFLVASTTDTWAKGRPFSLPPQAVEVAPGVFDLGISSDVDGVQVRGYAFVHPRKMPTHKNGREHGGKGGGKGGGGSDCFAFIAKGAYWKTIENYIVDPANNDGVSDADIRAYISNAIGQWETALGAPVFGDEDIAGTVDGADLISPDDKNEVLFGTFTDSNTVAVTIVWGIFGGPPPGRKLVEWDMVFNDPDYNWGNAGLTNETGLGDTNVMDFLNVATHEIGHATGLGHPSDACIEETMFRFTQNGETKRRTLHAGDIAGIQALYK